MIKFKQKEYVAPWLAALLPVALEGTVSLFNNKKNRELEEREMMLNSSLRRKQLELDEEKRKFAEKLIEKDPSTASSIFQGQGNFSFTDKARKVIDTIDYVSDPIYKLSTSFHRLSYPITTAMAIKNNGKDREIEKQRIEASTKLRMEELKNQKERFKDVQKLIKENPEIAAIIYQGQGQFSNTEAAKEIGKAAVDIFGKDILNRAVVPAALAGLGAYGVGKYINYLMKKNNVRYDRYGRLEERNYSIKDYFKGVKDNISTYATDLKTNPKDTLIDTAGGAFTTWPVVSPFGGASRSGMVNKKKIEEFAKKLSGSSDGNVVKIGEWIGKNPRYSTLMAILAGYGILKGTNKLTRKAIEESTKAFDPDAYEYFDAKTMKIKTRQRLFTKYDDTDDLKRMTDADILATPKQITHTASRSLNAGLGGSVIGALLASILSAKKNGFDLNKLGDSAKKGAIIGSLVGLGKGVLDTRKEREDADWFNRRLRYAKYQARRREAKDWRENIGGRERYTY